MNDSERFYDSMYLDGSYQKRTKPKHILDKERKIQTFLHYSEPNIKERTVFGVPSDSPYGHADLSYNYDDRLSYEYQKWSDAVQNALDCPYCDKSTARFYEIVLSVYFQRQIDIKHILLGCNMSTGYSYLVFGYK